MDNVDNLALNPLSSDEINKIEEFRKSKHTAVLAILFSDIVNSTHATETLGEQSYSKIRHIHDELFIKIMCRDNAGVIIKQIGDSFLCVFAEPSTSVSRAIEFQRAIRKNKEHLTIKDYTLTVRIGIHIGQVVVENKLAKDIFGSHVNRAARIESIATTGQILTSQSIWENAVGWLRDNNDEGIGWITYGKTKLKGLEGKVDIFGFYPKEIGPSPVPKIFRKQRKNQTLLRLTGLLLLAALVFFLAKHINQKDTRKEIDKNTTQRKSFYVQFDFSKIPNLDTSSIKDVLLSLIINTLYPDSVLTESDLIKSFSKQGKLYSKREINSPIEEMYFSDTLNFSGALFIKATAFDNKNSLITFNTGLSYWTTKFRSSNHYILSSRTENIKSYFGSWIQDRFLEFRLRDKQGIITESNDSIIFFQFDKEAKLSPGAAIRIRRSYSGKEGLSLWLTEHEIKMEYLKDKPQFAEELKNEKLKFENQRVEVVDFLSKGNSYLFWSGLSGKILELYDSVGKATWTNKSIFPFVKPQKGDLVFLDY